MQIYKNPEKKQVIYKNFKNLIYLSDNQDVKI